MISKNIPQDEFEFPIVTTKELIIKEHIDLLKASRGTYVLDLGCLINIFEYFPPANYIEENYVKSTTEYLLLQVANAYKWIDEDVLYNMLSDFADKLRKRSLGGVIPAGMYKHFINTAIINKDTIEVVPNKTIRYIVNPKYDYTGIPYEERHILQREVINIAIGLEKRRDNYDAIYEAIVDYDLNQKRLTKRIVESLTDVSYATIKNYLKEHPELDEAFKQVNRLSGTEKQQLNKKYNQAKN